MNGGLNLRLRDFTLRLRAARHARFAFANAPACARICDGMVWRGLPVLRRFFVRPLRNKQQRLASALL